MYCFNGDKIDYQCPRQLLKPEVSLLFHYRASNAHDKNKNLTEDTTVWKYKEELVREVKRVALEIGFKL
jgi:hypothetical protein